ncbi:hypothetical protein BDV26DRAFT_266277, partial [Aspergillus bertholletiae]
MLNRVHIRRNCHLEYIIVMTFFFSIQFLYCAMEASMTLSFASGLQALLAILSSSVLSACIPPYLGGS